MLDFFEQKIIRVGVCLQKVIETMACVDFLDVNNFLLVFLK